MGYRMLISSQLTILSCSRNSGMVGAPGQKILVGVPNTLSCLILNNAFKVAKETAEQEINEGPEPPAAEVISPEDRLLQLDSEGLWVLGPLPDAGSVLKIDLANALRSYVAQKWSKLASFKNIMY